MKRWPLVATCVLFIAATQLSGFLQIILRILVDQKKSNLLIRSSGRGERIRTSDYCVPNAVLYQAELHPALTPPAPLTRRGREGFKIAASRQSAPILANIACILNRQSLQWRRMPTPLRAELAGGGNPAHPWRE